MIERKDEGHYWYKIKDKQVYTKIMSEYSCFIPPSILNTMHHTGSTLKNEAVDTSNASLTPKHKYYSMTNWSGMSSSSFR